MIKINIEITKDIKNGIIVPQNDLIANLIVKNSSHNLKGCCEIKIIPILEGKKEKYWEKILNAKWSYMDFVSWADVEYVIDDFLYYVRALNRMSEKELSKLAMLLSIEEYNDVPRAIMYLDDFALITISDESVKQYILEHSCIPKKLRKFLDVEKILEQLKEDKIVICDENFGLLINEDLFENWIEEE